MIPEPVQEAFRLLIDLYGNKVKRLGERNGVSYFIFPFPEDCDTGFPQIVSYQNGKATPIEGFDAVKNLGKFR